jgi:hypothetical protein
MTSVKQLSEFIGIVNVHKQAGSEVEIRLKRINIKHFQTILSKLENIVFTQTLNAINQKTGLIRTITYKNDKVETNNQYTIKNKLYSYISQSATDVYTISLSSETSIEPKLMGADLIMRIKNRFSAQLKDIPWRLDLTIVLQHSSIPKDLNDIVDLMIKKLPSRPADIVNELARRNRNVTFEIEAEYTGQYGTLRPDNIDEIVNRVYTLIDANYTKNIPIQTELKKIANILKIENNGIKKMFPQVISLTRIDYRKIFPPLNYYISDKADGARAIAHISGNFACIITDCLNNFQPKNNLSYKTTILDGELITNPADQSITYYPFDIMYLNGEDYTKMPFKGRVAALPNAVEILKNSGVPAALKVFEQITDLTQMPAIVARLMKQKYEIDGLILVEPEKTYFETTTYKWKPNDKNTIDFLARLAPESQISLYPRKKGMVLYFLFVGCTAVNMDKFGLSPCPGYNEIFGDIPSGYFPIQFTVSATKDAYLFYHPTDELDNKIIELRCINGCAAAMGCGHVVEWELIRIRHDRESDLLAGRYFGNDYRIAELTWSNYIDPLTVEQLSDGPSDSYFMADKSDAYKAQIGCVNFMKNTRIASMQHAKWAIDLAAGKGQDLKKYIDADIKNLIAVDIDSSALAELVRRKYEHMRSSTSSRISINIMCTDIINPKDDIYSSFRRLGVPEEGADVLFCNLAFHYFAKTIDHIRQVIELCSKSVKSGGFVILTVFNGAAVFDRLKSVKTGETWDVIENGKRKYSIKKLYSDGPALLDCGQKIGVLHHFAGGEYYEEYLLNLDMLEREFKLMGFELEDRRGAAEYIDAYQASGSKHAAQLTPADIEYIELYGEICFVRD